MTPIERNDPNSPTKIDRPVCSDRFDHWLQPDVSTGLFATILVRLFDPSRLPAGSHLAGIFTTDGSESSIAGNPDCDSAGLHSHRGGETQFWTRPDHADDCRGCHQQRHSLAFQIFQATWHATTSLSQGNSLRLLRWMVKIGLPSTFENKSSKP